MIRTNEEALKDRINALTIEANIGKVLGIGVESTTFSKRGGNNLWFIGTLDRYGTPIYHIFCVSGSNREFEVYIKDKDITHEIYRLLLNNGYVPF